MRTTRPRVLAVVAVVALAGAAACGGRARPRSTAVGGTCSAGKGNTLTCYGTSADTAMQKTESEIVERANRQLTIPLGEGPWPFAVVRTRGAGLPVRAAAKPGARQVGKLQYRKIAWVWCSQRPGDGPWPVAGDKPVWVQLNWPNASPSKAVFESRHSDTARAWADGRFLVPVGQNGAVPRC